MASGGAVVDRPGGDSCLEGVSLIRRWLPPGGRREMSGHAAGRPLSARGSVLDRKQIGAGTASGRDEDNSGTGCVPG